MRRLARRQRIVRVVVSVLLALVASLRSGGIALACELASAPKHDAMQMNNASMPSHDDSSSKGCDEPDRVRECALMAACAPAVFASVEAGTTTTAGAAGEIVAVSRAPAAVDRAPEPPPPRA